MLQTFIKKCVNVEKLGIAETKLNCGHLSAIFLKCKKVTQLSVSLHQHDLKIVKFNSHSTFTVDDTCLKNSGDCLKQIKKLEVVVHSGSFGETSLFIRYTPRSNNYSSNTFNVTFPHDLVSVIL